MSAEAARLTVADMKERIRPLGDRPSTDEEVSAWRTASRTRSR